MVRGNWLLRGWILGSDSLWLTDGLVYAAGFALRSLDPVLLHVVPAVVGIALVGAVVAAATAGRKGPAVSFASVLAILPIVFPSSLMVEVLLGPYHTAAMIVALLSTVALYHAQERFDRPMQVWAMTGFAFVLLTAGTLSDPIPLSSPWPRSRWCRLHEHSLCGLRSGAPPVAPPCRRRRLVRLRPPLRRG